MDEIERHIRNRRIWRQVDILILIAVTLAGFFLSMQSDWLEFLYELSRTYEKLEIDELVCTMLFAFLALAVIILRRWLSALHIEHILMQQNEDLSRLVSEIRQLKGILPICASCKKIRNDEGFWQEVESYISEHSDANFSHGICPSCYKKLYPELIPVKDIKKP